MQLMIAQEVSRLLYRGGGGDGGRLVIELMQ